MTTMLSSSATETRRKAPVRRLHVAQVVTRFTAGAGGITRGALALDRDRTALSTPMEVGLSLLRALNPWRLISTLAPGRVAVGRRT